LTTGGAVALQPVVVTRKTPAQLFWARLRQDKAALVGGVVIVLLVIIAIIGGPLAETLTGHPQNTTYNQMTDAYGVPKGPNSQFWFGADAAGRDLFVRTMYGARTSLFVGIVASGIAVLIGLVGVTIGLPWADSAAALLVAAIIARSAAKVAWRSGDILMDRAPAGAERQLRTAIQGVTGVREVRSVRVRRSGPSLIGDASIATARMLSLEAAGALVEEVKRVAMATLPSLDLTVVVEGQTRPSDLVERVHAAAARNGGVRDLHNVTVERENDGSLHLTMHAKLPGDMTLATASLASAELERTLRTELPQANRVDIHLEPMEPHVVRGEDVTSRRTQLASKMRAVVESHPEVRRCVDVELSDRHSRIYAHVVAELDGNVSLEHAHQVESELEQQIRRALPEVHEVVARAVA
jgi:divalent metal cation (Fe/Co/Zn/Cd) transporter